MLVPARSVDFATIRDTLGLADSVVSKHVTRLEAVGYVTTVKKSTGKGRPHTWISLTKAGRVAFAGHVAALRQIAAGLGPEP